MNHSIPGLPITNSWSLLKPMSIKSVMPSNHFILCHPLLLLPSIPPSIRVFFNESFLRIRWPKYWSFSFSISPSNEYPGLISFRMDWMDLLAVQGTLKSLLQNHSSKTSIFQPSAFFTVQLSHPYMTTGKTIALTRQTFVGKVMSLLFNMLSRLVITFLPRSKHLLVGIYFKMFRFCKVQGYTFSVGYEMVCFFYSWGDGNFRTQRGKQSSVNGFCSFSIPSQVGVSRNPHTATTPGQVRHLNSLDPGADKVHG